MDKQKLMTEVINKYRADPHFDHLRSNGKFVPGEGPLDARIVLVGEAPGEDEAAAGRPFVGPAGEVLAYLLKKAELRRNEVYITNVVKYRPTNDIGKNRIPTDPEVDHSLAHLYREINIVDPEVIGLMGKVAIQSFYPLRTPSKFHGQVHKLSYDSRPHVFLYHPAFAIYTKSMLPQMVEDFKAVTEALDPIT